MFPRWPLSAEIKVQTCSVFEKCLWCLRYSPALSVRTGSRGELRISSSVLFQVYDELLKRYAQLEERVVQKSHSWASNRHQWNPATAIFYWSQLWVWLLHLKEDQSHHRNPQPPEDGLLVLTSAWLDQWHHHHVKAWLEDSINTAPCDFIWGSRFPQSTSSETEKKLKWWNSQRGVTRRI